ncbi:MAG: preprotein translocase subunit SecE [Acidimicrobiales bacterium]
MAMNREQRRYLQRQGQLDDEGNPVASRREQQRPPSASERSSPRQYVSEVRTELRRVNWPTKSEVINYTIVVLVTLAVVTALIAALDYVFAEGVIQLLKLGS